MIVSKAFRITTSVTTNAFSQSVVLTQIVISVNNNGTAWDLRIQDRRSPNPFVLIPNVALSAPSAPSAVINTFPQGVYMMNGVDIVTTGPNPGEVAIWFGVQQTSGT